MLFVCDGCGTVDCTDLASPQAPDRPGEMLCSCCLPSIAKWHGYFPKLKYRPGVDDVCNRPTGIGLS